MITCPATSTTSLHGQHPLSVQTTCKYNSNNDICLYRANSTLQFSNAPYNKRTVYYKYMPGILHFIPRKYMLLAGWEVRIGKNCDGGLENAARGHRPRAAFSSPRSQFFPIRTDPKAANNIFIFFFLP